MRRLLAGAALVTGIVGVGCDSGTAPEPTRAGTTAIYLTDAPFPYGEVAEVNVHVVNVELSTSTDTSAATGWLEVAAPDHSYDLLSLRDGTSELLGSAIIPPDDYRALRLRIDTDRSNMVLRDGRVLGSTSGTGPGIDWQSSAGIAVLHAIIYDPLNVSTDGADILMDFDVGMSFFPLAPDHFIFSPVIRAINMAAAGSLTGTVLAPLGPLGAAIPVEFASVEFVLDDPLPHWGLQGVRIATATTDASGNFRVTNLMPRQYRVAVEFSSGGGLWTGWSQPATVTAGRTATVGPILLTATLPEPPTDSTPGPAPPPVPPPDSTAGSAPPPVPPPPPPPDTLGGVRQ